MAMDTYDEGESEGEVDGQWAGGVRLTLQASFNKVFRRYYAEAKIELHVELDKGLKGF